MDLVGWLGTVAAAGVGTGVGGYLKVKGENLATHQDIERLTRQVEEVKAEISDVVWNRQKRWELKREVVFEATRRNTEVEEALVGLYAAVIQAEPDELVHKVEWQKHLNVAFERYSNSLAALEQAVALVALVCEKETHHAFMNAKSVVLQIVQDIKKNPAIYTTRQKEYMRLLTVLSWVARKELGIDPP